MYFHSLFERQGDRVDSYRQEIFHLLVCCLNACGSLGWAWLRPGAWDSIWVSHIAGRDPSTWAIPCSPLRCTLAEVRLEEEPDQSQRPLICNVDGPPGILTTVSNACLSSLAVSPDVVFHCSPAQKPTYPWTFPWLCSCWWNLHCRCPDVLLQNVFFFIMSSWHHHFPSLSNPSPTHTQLVVL